MEDTLEDDDAVPVEVSHRNYDQMMEDTPPGKRFLSWCKSVPGARRWRQCKLGISRTPFIECLGPTRESYYEARLVLGLSWFCAETPHLVEDTDGAERAVWTFLWHPPDAEDLGGRALEPVVLKLGPGYSISFEERCAELERQFAEQDLVCACCTNELQTACPACQHATGWHRCSLEQNHRHLLWCKGTLHGGVLDVQRVLFGLHRKGVPLPHLRDRAEEYTQAALIPREQADRVIRCIEQERGHARVANEAGDAPDEPAAPASLSSKMSPEQMRAELHDRELKLQSGGPPGRATDQWRVGSG